MGDFIKTQNSFASGEVAPEFYARDKIQGLSVLENMDVLSGGGLSRRCGLASVAEFDADARLIAFSVSEDEDYLLVLKNDHMYVYYQNELLQNLLTPWNSDMLEKLQYAQRFGTMIFVHPDYRPMVLEKTETYFSLTSFVFEINSDFSSNMPFMQFDDADGITITVTANSLGSNYATFTTSNAFWTSDNYGSTIYLLDKQWTIISYISATQVVASVNGSYSLPTAAVTDWYEGAFGTRRGWPCSITFHQDRLVFGGSRSYEAGIWMSKVGNHYNFDTGTGLDDEAIYLTLLSQQRQQICTVVSSENLQILTSVGEWVISSTPLTPSSVDIQQYTSVGSVASRYLPPQQIEGSTIFVSSSKKDIRELSLDEVYETYNATDLCALSKHMMCDPNDIAYNVLTKQLFVPMNDGDMAVLNQNAALGISAWARYTTNGTFRSVAVIDGVTYVIVQRDDAYCLEYFSSDELRDAGQYDFSFTVSALPFRASGHNAGKLRIRKISARVLNTKSLYINDMRIALPNHIYDTDSAGYSGDVSVRVLGTQDNCVLAPWTISSSKNLPTTILSITVYGYYIV